MAAARIMFGPHMNLQAPPNLTPAGPQGSSEAGREWRALLDAGINDWGGWLDVNTLHCSSACLSQLCFTGYMLLGDCAHISGGFVLMVLGVCEVRAANASAYAAVLEPTSAAGTKTCIQPAVALPPLPFELSYDCACMQAAYLPSLGIM